MTAKVKGKRKADPKRGQNPSFYNDQLGENASEFYGREYDNKSDKRKE